MNASETQLGPPSEPINVREFLEQCNRCEFLNHSALNDPGQFSAVNSSSPFSEWEDLPDEAQHDIEEECCINTLRDAINATISDPFYYAHLVQNQEANITAIRAAADPVGQPKKKSRKRKRAGSLASDEIRLPPEILQFQYSLDSISLKCWPYPADAAVFIRQQKNTDLNVLIKPRNVRNADPPSPEPREGPVALIVISVYNRLSWGNHISRASQHAVLSSQSIGDLYEAIVCPSNEIPLEDAVDGEKAVYKTDEPPPHRGCVVCIEGVAYGDGQSETDYSDKLLKHVEMMPPNKRPLIVKGTGMHEQLFADLTLRLHQPYWLLHQGACEHFLVVNQIRMLHPSDPIDGYPLALHITPPMLDLCQACSRVPAVLSVVGDIRLGQSPCKLCSPCWAQMGEPRSGEDIFVVPLPTFELGW